MQDKSPLYERTKEGCIKMAAFHPGGALWRILRAKHPEAFRQIKNAWRRHRRRLMKEVARGL